MHFLETEQGLLSKYIFYSTVLWLFSCIISSHCNRSTTGCQECSTKPKRMILYMTTNVKFTKGCHNRCVKLSDVPVHKRLISFEKMLFSSVILTLIYLYYLFQFKCAQRNLIWVTCEGESPADVENLGPVNYSPRRGFPAYFFPYRNVKGYQPPIVAVQFERPKRK